MDIAESEAHIGAGEVDKPNIGIVVPTLGTRNIYLQECIRSIRDAGSDIIVVVRPPGVTVPGEITDLIDFEVDDPGLGLAAAINKGMLAFPDNVTLVNWLGDDDRLTRNSLNVARSELIRAGAIGVFGQCRYISPSGDELWVNRSGRFAVPLLHFGPQLIPQPGALYLRSAFLNIGLLDTNYRWAFDLQMFMALKRIGKLHYVSEVLAEFRWHPGSLSVGGRVGSVNEASQIRVRNLPRWLRPFSQFWEPLTRRVILTAGDRMNVRLSKVS